MNVSAFQSTALRNSSNRYLVQRCYKNGVIVLFSVIVLLTSVSPSARSAEVGGSRIASIEFAAPQGMFIVGEKLEYEVSYSIFSLGTVSVEILDTVRRAGTVLYRAQALMDSYSGVPFVSLHWMFYSEIDPHFYSHFFSGDDRKDTANISYSDYTFDYPRGKVFVEKGITAKRELSTKKTDTISTTYQDGLSLFYYARGNVHSNREANVPTFVNESKVNTYINFVHKPGSSEIDAIKYPVQTLKFEGRADFVGIFGLTGGFEGWFSDDDAAIPIVAKMKVILGSIRLELVRWHRDGWVPPRAVGE